MAGAVADALGRFRPRIAELGAADRSGLTARTAGVRATLHDCRRSFSTLAQRAGVDRGVVKGLDGWSTVGEVERRHPAEMQPVLERAMERIAKAQGVA